MKTAIKITALAAAIMLIAISCAPEVELTARDWKQKTADEDTAKLSIDGSIIPSVTSNLRFPITRESHRDVEITFSKEADVLRTDNAAIVGKLKEFMQFYTYTKGATSDLADTLAMSIDYTFVNRFLVTNGERITVRLDAVPNENLVIKIDANKYTYAAGRKLGSDEDTRPGTPYYDVYISCPVGGASSKPLFVNPYWLGTTLTIGLSGSGSGSSIITTVAELTFPSGVGLTTGERNIVQDSFLSGLVANNKLKLKKYGSRGWEDDAGGIFSYNTNNRVINLMYNREEFTPYRVEATGMNDLTVNYLGVNQRVTVKGSGEQTGGFNRSTVVSDVSYWYDSSSHYMATGSAAGNLVSNVELETVDKEGKNAVYRLWFKSLPFSGTNYYLGQMNLAEFKKNVKLVFRQSGGALTGLSSLNDLCYIDIKDIEYSSSSSIDLDILKVIPDPNFNIKTLGNRQVYFLLSPGFRYNNGNIIFGNYSNWDVEIDGVRYFDAYGPIPLTSGAPPLSTPTGLTVTGTTSNSISLGWTLVLGASGYDIYRSVNSSIGSGDYLATSSSVSYTDNTVFPGIAYYYYVKAINTSGDESSPSSVVSQTTTPPSGGGGSTLSAPTMLNATAQSSSSIYLSWSSVSGAGGYAVYRSSSSSGTYNPVALIETGTFYTDDGLSASTTYYYKVATVNNNGVGAQSVYDSATTSSDGGIAIPIPPGNESQ